jgi:dethiobiotin synthetase
MPFRPEYLVVVLGTATGVGKTWVTAALVQALHDAGIEAVARKPVQSYAPVDVAATDAHLLAVHESPDDVCPRHRWYEVALAPPMAADALGRPPFTVSDLVGELRWPPATQVGLVETVGGPRSPIAAEGDSRDLAAALDPDLVLLVAAAGLGAINAVRLSVGAVTTLGKPTVVLLNRYRDEDPDRRNRAWLDQEGYDVVTSVGDASDRVTGGLKNSL